MRVTVGTGVCKYLIPHSPCQPRMCCNLHERSSKDAPTKSGTNNTLNPLTAVFCYLSFTLMRWSIRLYRTTSDVLHTMRQYLSYLYVQRFHIQILKVILVSILVIRSALFALILLLFTEYNWVVLTTMQILDQQYLLVLMNIISCINYIIKWNNIHRYRRATNRNYLPMSSCHQYLLIYSHLIWYPNDKNVYPLIIFQQQYQSITVVPSSYPSGQI